mgnify:FL=1
MTYIHRTLEDTIKPYLDRKEAISIIGPRQAGKTTFVQKLIESIGQTKKIKFITFENQADLNLFNSDIESFKNIITQYDLVTIDEFQYAKDGGKNLKYLYDTTNIKFIVTGSSSLDLTFHTDKYMVGRLLSFTLPPLSFREFLSYKDIDLWHLTNSVSTTGISSFKPSNGFGEEINHRLTKLAEEYAVFGGYPAVITTDDKEQKKAILNNIVDKYMLKDVKELLRLATDAEMIRLQKSLAAQIGGMVKYEALSNACDLPFRDVKEHLAILEKTYVISLVSPFFRNKQTDISKNPKVYFFDLGFRNSILNDFQDIEGRPDKGQIMENFAFNLMQREYVFVPNGHKTALKYWRSKSKAEVDFVIENGPELLPIEIKYSSNKVAGKSMYSFINRFEPPLAVILTKDFTAEDKIDNTRVIYAPITYF